MAFVNTIDLLGDAVVMDALISRTITEYNDDVITRIGFRETGHVFLGCKELLKVRFPKATNGGGWTFQECSKLYLADFGSSNIATIYFWYGAFFNCSSLKALVLRGNTVPNVGSIFNSSTIASGTGYIYVPRSLVDSYKVATNWSTYGDQFRAVEDYTVDGTIDGDIDESKIWA